jgi:hypothetical protein
VITDQVDEPLTADPVEAHVAALSRALHGPSRARHSMIREVREGLHDAVAAHRARGLDARGAAARTLEEFGPVGDVAPLLQEELTVRHCRLTALLVAVVFPGMLGAWDLLWSSGLAGVGAEAPAFVATLARAQDIVSALVAATAIALLLATFRRAARARRITMLVGFAGGAGALLCGGMSVLMCLANPQSAPHALASPATLAAYGCSAVVLVLLVTLAVRTVRVARADRGR